MNIEQELKEEAVVKEAPEKELSLRETIEAGFEEAKAVQADKSPIEGEKPVREPKADKEPTIETAEADKAEKPAIQAPNSWTAAAKAEFDKVPPLVQQEILKREADMHKGIVKADEERTFGKNLKEIVNPYMPFIQANGGNAPETIQNLLNSAYVLHTGTPQQKVALFQQIAKQYGVDIASVQQEQQQQWVDPQVQSLQQEIQNLRQWQTQQNNLQEQQIYSKLQEDLNAFTQNPANRHLDSLRERMAEFLSANVARDFQHAYNLAYAERDDLRAADNMLKQQKGQQVAPPQTKTQQIRQQSSSVFGAPNGTSGANELQGLSLSDTIRQALRAANA